MAVQTQSPSPTPVPSALPPRAGRIEITVGPMFSGKCLGRDTKVRLHGSSNPLPVQNIMPGMLLISECFRPVKVKTITHGVGEMWKVWQSGEGMSYTVNSDHIMTVFKKSDCCLVDVPFKVLQKTLKETKSAPDYFGVRMVLFKGMQQMTFTELSFTYEGPGEYFGFTLDSDSTGRFLLEDNTVTHNTSKMLCRVLDLHYTRYKCCVVRSNKDTRGKKETWGAHCGTNLRGLEALIPVYTTDLLMDIVDECELAEVIGIDEGQFFQDLEEFALHMAHLGKIVVIASLDSTFDGEDFGAAYKLLKNASVFKKISHECQCRRGDAIYNVLKSTETTPVVGGSKILIGGSDKYDVVCLLCLEEIKKQKTLSPSQQK
jgi:thymidine kinase